MRPASGWLRVKSAGRRGWYSGGVLIALRVPGGNDRGPLYTDQALAAIHQGNPDRRALSLEFGSYDGSVSLFSRVPPELRSAVETQLYALYPDCRLERLSEHSLDPPTGHRPFIAELRLRPDLFPIRRYSQFEDALNRVTADPVTGILHALGGAKNAPLSARVTIAVRPASGKRCDRSLRVLRSLAHPFFRTHPRLAQRFALAATSPWPPLRVLAWLFARAFREHVPQSSTDPLAVSSSRLHEREEDLQAASDKLGRLLFEARIQLTVAAPKGKGRLARRRLREIAGSFGQFSSPRLGSFKVRYRGFLTRWLPCTTFLLSTEELATLWHPPTLSVRAPTLATVESRELPPPVQVPRPREHTDLAVLGRTCFRSNRSPFGILPDDRRRHVAVLGKTGMGKTTLLQNLLLSDIAGGRGVALLDPHGDLVESLLALIPKRRTNDVILFDAGDQAHPLSFNPLAGCTPEQRPLVASGIVSAFKKLYADSWGPRLEHILRNALLALLEVPGTTLLSLLRLLSEPGYRKAMVAKLSDPVVRAFWEREFAAMHPKLQAEAIAPVQNKVGHFVSSPLLRHIIGQPRSSLDLRRIMDQGQVLLVNLSKGRLGDDASALLGSLLVTSTQLAAMSRADTPEADRRDFFLYVDEFQNFATESFATVLSEARKYRLALTVANQYLAQMEEQTADAVFGNVGTLLVFQVGARDAEVLAEQLGADVSPKDLLQLPRYAAYARLLIEGTPSRPFSMQTLPPPRPRGDSQHPDVLRRHAKQRYGRPAREVEADIRRAYVFA